MLITSPSSDRSFVRRRERSSTIPWTSSAGIAIVSPTGVPTLDEHAEPGEDVDQDALDREARENQDERGARDRGEAVEAAADQRAGEDEGGHEGDVSDPGANDRDGRLAPLELDDLRPQIAGRRVMMVPVVPGQTLAGNKGGQARDSPRSREQQNDCEWLEHLLQTSPRTKLSTGFPVSQAQRPNLYDVLTS
jgi:hypothetical protein